MSIDWPLVVNYLSKNATDLVIKLAVAMAGWYIGRWIIKLLTRLLSRALLRAGQVDSNLSKYLCTIVSIVLTIGLALGVLGYLGVQTTSFAALIAGVGLAIGTAWGGLLTHFAAGAFLQVLRPFKVGDYISVSGAEGTVREIGLFSTTLLSADNVTTIIGNNKIYSDSIRNFSRQPHRRVDAVAKLAYSSDALAAIEKIREAIIDIDNVLSDPTPQVEILSFNTDGLQIAVRPHCQTQHYPQVMFDVNRRIFSICKSEGYAMVEHPPR